jgi:hypothetical protein
VVRTDESGVLVCQLTGVTAGGPKFQGDGFEGALRADRGSSVDLDGKKVDLVRR